MNRFAKDWEILTKKKPESFLAIVQSYLVIAECYLAIAECYLAIAKDAVNATKQKVAALLVLVVVDVDT